SSRHRSACAKRYALQRDHHVVVPPPPGDLLLIGNVRVARLVGAAGLARGLLGLVLAQLGQRQRGRRRRARRTPPPAPPRPRVSQGGPACSVATVAGVQRQMTPLPEVGEGKRTSTTKRRAIGPYIPPRRA